MAQTTTAINACDVSVWLDNAAGVLTDISGSSNKLDMNFDHEIGEYRAFQGKWPGRLCCGKDAAFTLDVIYSSTATEGLALLRDWYFTAGAACKRTMHVYIPTKNVGADYYAMEVVLKNLKFAADRGVPGPIMVSAQLLPSGDVTLSTVAT
jgi:hypothetical protein